MANKTTHYEVFDYWKDKSIDKHGTCYTGDNIDFLNTIPIVNDWGEPECYACGCSAIDYSHMEDDERYDQALKEDDGLKYIYSRKDVKHNLQLAHIRPKALQGEDIPSNFMLLCPRCHRDAPDILNRKLFLQWIYKRRKEGSVYKRCFEKAKQILNEIYNINTKWTLINIDSALDRTKVNVHGSILCEDTITYGFVQEALLNKTELKEEYERMFKFTIEEQIKKIKSKYNINTKIEQYSEVDKAILDTLEGVLTQYDTFKTLEMAG